jgi:hypothetical protein
MKTVEKGAIWPDMDNNTAASDDTAARKPQPDNHRGTSFDL